MSDRAILHQKLEVLAQYADRIGAPHKRMTDILWHDRRILLKRYHHTLDAFALCPGHLRDEALIDRISMLEKLLGDWHDRVVCIDLLRRLELQTTASAAISEFNREARALRGSAALYLRRFSRQQNPD